MLLFKTITRKTRFEFKNIKDILKWGKSIGFWKYYDCGSNFFLLVFRAAIKNSIQKTPALPAFQNGIVCNQKRNIDVLKLCWNLFYLASVCLHKIARENFQPLTWVDRNVPEWRCEKFFLMDHLLFPQAKNLLLDVSSQSTKIGKSVVRIDANQL